jgi:hypothetical protein
MEAAHLAVAIGRERRLLSPAARLGEAAARVELAAGRPVARARHHARDGRQAPAALATLRQGVEQGPGIGVARLAEEAIDAARLDLNSRSTPRVSTCWPAYMTLTVRAVSAITPMSWVISTSAMPCSRCRRKSRSRICA